MNRHLFLFVVSMLSQNSRLRRKKGELVARALSGSWRAEGTHEFELSPQELDEVTPLLYGSGAAALGWWRVRHTELKESPSAEVLHQAYRLQSLQSAIHEQKIEKVFRLMREAGIAALLAKGWAASRLYPDFALRPYGDIDLLVHPDDISRATDVLETPEASDCWVDLHKGFDEIDERSVEDLFNRSMQISLGSETIRVLSAEDHLALLSVHLLKHGAWRPLWLCDIGAALESISDSFRWDICLGSNRTHSHWITCAMVLAHRLLNAEPSETARPYVDFSIPTWLEMNVLEQWAAPFAINQPPMCHSASMADHLKHPTGILKGLRERWPNPILATVSINGEFNEFPRLPYQVGNWALRAGQFIVSLPTRLRSQSH